MSRQSKYSSFFRTWWTVLALLFCYGFYLHGMHQKKEVLQEISGRVALLEQHLNAAYETREDLAMQLKSQSDPAWIEMLLKKNLGMVSPGQTKVYFDQE